MQENSRANVFILGFFIFLGLSSLGYLLANAAVKVKEYERSVTAKGLSEREYTADIVIWPIQFTAANNDLSQLYKLVDANSLKIKQFLLKKGIKEKEVSFSSPVITDKSAQQYGNAKAEFRYAAMQTVTVYSEDIKHVREMMNSLSELGRSGIAFTGNNYQSQTKYIFTRLNEVKPEMIEEATKQARVVAQKFAADSQSKLGKIRKASQGQFSISARDQNSPHIKKVRVVSTVEYYLSD
jgi:hypothetical protein